MQVVESARVMSCAGVSPTPRAFKRVSMRLANSGESSSARFRGGGVGAPMFSGICDSPIRNCSGVFITNRFTSFTKRRCPAEAS